ncbi:MAG: SRPBCC family protein [Acidobacteriota bacterium]
MTPYPAHEHSLSRAVSIRAERETVFRYFTDPERFAMWWGAGSNIDARPGGRLVIRYPNGVLATGEVLEVHAPERIVFTYGYEDPGKPIPPGGSRVTITLEEEPSGTMLRLVHALADAAARDAHVPGWRYQLAVFANVVAREQHAKLADVVDRYLAAWNEADAGKRRELLASSTVPDVAFADGFGCVRGQDELEGHIAAARMHRPGMTLSRAGDPRQCQGTAVCDWLAAGPDGATAARGTNVLDLAPDGRLARIVGLWSA